MYENVYSRQIVRYFPHLPNDILAPFLKIWNENRISYKHDNKIADEIDRLSAQLVSTAIYKMSNLLVILPDKAPHRSATLFTTALMMYGISQIKNNLTSGNVLYFSSEVGIREQLRDISVNGIVMDSVFNQSRLTKSGNELNEKNSKQISGQFLPRVICAYAPADPTLVFNNQNVDWVAVDCSDKSSIYWLKPLLAYICELKIPIIAWSQNALSDSILEFRHSDINIFHWPYKIPDNSRIHDLYNSDNTTITPLVLDGESSDIITNPLKNAYRLLGQATALENGRLSKDAIRIGWSCLKQIESLSVPFDLFEAETCHYWGLSKIVYLFDGLERFINELQNSNYELFIILKKAFFHLENSISYLRNYNSPMWDVLTNLCITDIPKDIIRTIVFTSSAKKQIFSFALLAKYNINETDLRELNVQLSCIKDISKFGIDYYFDEFTIKKEMRKEIIVVGLPSPLLSSYLEPILRMEQVKFLIYSYQIPSLTKMVNEWSRSLNVNDADNDKTLRILGGENQYREVFQQKNSIILQEPTFISTSQKNSKTSGVSSRVQNAIWVAPDPFEEASWLLSQSEPLEENINSISDAVYDDDLESTKEEVKEQKAWIDKVIEIDFNFNWHGLFSPGEKINVILSNEKGECIEKRYISSLRINDKVLFIQGQRRQNLYDLIISRVHKHPSIELHIALIQRWHEDLIRYYREWKINSNLGIDDLLARMQDNGSNIGTPSTIRNWLKGITLCPERYQDLEIIAKILGMDFVLKNSDRIFKAAKRLYGLHIGLSRRLNKWLSQKASGFYAEKETEIFDEELGLSIQDFKDSLLILQVQSSRVREGLFYCSDLGNLERR